MGDRWPVWTVGETADLASPHFYKSPEHETVFRDAARVHPIAWAQPPGDEGFWSVVTYELGSRVLRHPDQFESKRGMRLGGSPTAVQAAADRMIVVSDGKRHKALRATLAAWFNNYEFTDLRSTLDREIDSLLRDLTADGQQFDVVEGLATKIASLAFFHILGLPREDWAGLARLAADAFNESDGGRQAARKRSLAHGTIFSYFSDLVPKRRGSSGQDIITMLANSRIEGREIPDEDVVLNCDGLLNGGLESTPNAISGAVLAFARYPDAWRRLRENPDLTGHAVEEILRWTSPGRQVMRTATRESMLGPAQIRAGDRVVVWLPQCNRDEAVFPHADHFDIGREPNPHMTFGWGPHYCVAAQLARVELGCFLATMIRQVQTIQVTGRVSRQASALINGLECLEVTMTGQKSYYRSEIIGTAGLRAAACGHGPAADPGAC